MLNLDMRETLRCLLLPFLLTIIHAALFEEEGSTRRVETEENVTSDLVPRTDFVRIIRASGERHERQISRRFETFGDGERHMITVDRNGNVLQFRRPSPFFSLQSSSFRQPPFFQRGITRSRSSHGFSRRRLTISPLVTIRPRTTTVTHDGSMDTVLQPLENTLQPPTVTREGTVTNEFNRIPVRTQNSPTDRVQSLRLIHGGSMEREESRERVPIAHPMRERPLRISSSFEVLPRRENNRFRIGGPPFGEVTTPVPFTRVFIQTPRPFRLRPPPIRQRPQPPRRVEALSNDEEEFTPSGRSPVSPSVVAPFRSFRPHLPSTRFTLPPRSPIRTGPSPLHTSPFPSTTFSSTQPSTTHSPTPSTTSVTESLTTTQLTTPSSTTIEVTTEGTTFGTTATTSRPTISSTLSSRRPTISQSTTSRSSTRDLNPVSPFLHSSSFLRPSHSTHSPSTLEPLHLTPPPSPSPSSPSSPPSTSPSPFLPSPTIPIQRDPQPDTQSTDSPSSHSSASSSFEDSREFSSISSGSESSIPSSTDSTTHPPSSTSTHSSSPTTHSSTTPSPPSSTSHSTHPHTPDPSSVFRDSPPPFNENVHIITTTRSSLSSPQFDLSDLPDEFNFESSTESSRESSREFEGPSPTRSKPTLPRTDKITVTKAVTSIGKTTIVPKSSTVLKTTTVPKSTTVTPAVTRVTPPPTTVKTRRTGTTRGFATVSPSISVKALPPAIPDDLSFNGIRGPLPPVPISSHSPHSTTVHPPTGRGPSFPPSLSFDGPPGEMPPSDNVVQMLNDADDFLEMARRLNITRKARIARRRKRMAEYGRSKW